MIDFKAVWAYVKLNWQQILTSVVAGYLAGKVPAVNAGTGWVAKLFGG